MCSKNRFPIITSGREAQYDTGTMTDIILSCCVLHNFLLVYDSEADVFSIIDNSQSLQEEFAERHSVQQNENTGSTEYERGAEIGML